MKKLLLLAVIMISASAMSQDSEYKKELRKRAEANRAELVLLTQYTNEINDEEEMFAAEFAADDAAFALKNPIGVESVNKEIDVWTRKREYKNARLEECDKTRVLLDTEKPKLTNRKSIFEWKIISDNLKETRRVIKCLGNTKK